MKSLQLNCLLSCLLFILFSCKQTSPSDSILSSAYTQIGEELSGIIQQEIVQKDIPAISIALVDDQEVVFAEGFGFQDAEKNIPATASSIYRIGSVSKLFTDMAIMQEVERGKLNLDAPITDYLPDFKPDNPFDKEISLRQLMSHRAGLVREPPLGHYFDDSGTSLLATVESLYQTQLVYEPETRTKYSNAGIAVVGYVLEHLHGQAFADLLDQRLLQPLGMSSSAFHADGIDRTRLIEAEMWTYDGRNFPAPTFELGMAPAGSMYASVLDLAKFMQVMFEGGKLPNGNQLLQQETLEAMWTPQFAKEGATHGYGLGFAVGTVAGHRMIGHGGAIYGFSTEIMMLPEEKLGVVVVCGKDFTNPVMDRIATHALQAALALRKDEKMPQWQQTETVGKDLAEKMAGRYKVGNAQIDLLARGDRLFQEGRTYKMELMRLEGDTLTVDDPLGFGGKLYASSEGNLVIGRDTVFKVDIEKPSPLSLEEKSYIGEYGWDYNTLYILERRGQLHVIIEWFPMYPISKHATDVYNFPNYGLYHGEQLVFERDEDGNIEGVRAAGILFERRLTDIEEGETFQITPLKPADELREIALAAHPPAEVGEFKSVDLVDLASLDPSIKYDIRYASDNNFMGVPFYQQSKAYMQRPAAEAVVRIHQQLKEKGLGLLIHDAYRPWFVTKMFWDATPVEFKHFVADPQKGSRHNRGCAVDLTLYDLETGEVLQTVGGYDEFSARSYPDYPGGTEMQRYYREVLREAMEAGGFDVYQWEWWHFDYKDWRSYPISTMTFEELQQTQ